MGVRHGLLLSFILAITACDDQRILPPTTGTAGEVMVIMDAVHYETDPGEAVRGAFQQWILTLPQREPRFTLVNFSHASFTSMLRTHRNVFIGEIDPSIKKAEVRKQQDLWAKGQLVVQVVAPNVTEWLKVFNQQAAQIAELIDEKERERLQLAQRKLEDPVHAQRTSQHFGVNVHIPKDFIMIDGNDEFMHFRRDRKIRSRTSNGPDLAHNVIDGIMVYSYDYVDDSTFTRKALMDRRDSLLKAYVPGPRRGSYMATQRFFEDMDLRPSMKAVTLDDRFATEMRGLWGMVNAKMGGPFVSVSMVHESRGKVVAVEGYAYAPQFDKREFLRYVDAIVYSTERSEEQPSDGQLRAKN